MSMNVKLAAYSLIQPGVLVMSKTCHNSWHVLPCQGSTLTVINVTSIDIRISSTRSIIKHRTLNTG